MKENLQTLYFCYKKMTNWLWKKFKMLLAYVKVFQMYISFYIDCAVEAQKLSLVKIFVWSEWKTTFPFTKHVLSVLKHSNEILYSIFDDFDSNRLDSKIYKIWLNWKSIKKIELFYERKIDGKIYDCIIIVNKIWIYLHFTRSSNWLETVSPSAFMALHE